MKFWPKRATVVSLSDEKFDEIHAEAMRNAQQDLVIKDALAHYCEHCKTGFKTKGATLAHKRYKHKPDSKTGVEAGDNENPGKTL